ncbi:MAG: TonB-dependent receptor [Prevotella sp.]|nr:TonB-dependent receptor [Prevotella sp.]
MNRLLKILAVVIAINSFPLGRFGGGLYAQDNSARIYSQAENDYKIGRIEEARDTLLHNIGSIHGNLKKSSLRLISLCYLARFEMKEAEQYATLMLNEDPYYSISPQDPPSFADIVNNVKAGMAATITTASSQAESLAEVPVPTTLITEEMIHNSGARNLQELLAAYVPGMHIVDGNDDINIAMRGIYSTTQEKILIMLNGHRLNNYATNTAAPDFSMSLEKVKQIEVLRGPASSLYGGVALTAVVNIITKQGADVDGMLIKAGAGNHSQVKGDLLFGKRYFDTDILVWGSLYRNSGEGIGIPAERNMESIYGMPYDRMTVGRIGSKPSYDFGLQLGWKGLRFMYNTHFSQVVAPCTMTSLAMSYDHDRYRTFNGISPSFGTFSRHADLSYTHQLGNVNMKYVITYDNADITRYQVISDVPLDNIEDAMLLPSSIGKLMSMYGGLSRYVNGQEQNYGVQVKGNLPYSIGDDHKGSLGFGAEYSYFNLEDFRYLFGYDFDKTVEDSRLQEEGKGHENSCNAYVQLKHQWKSLIFNAGLRFDQKTRYDHESITQLSPRIALILLQPKWNMKLSYSKSFVDAPYIYRKANVMSSLMVGVPTEDLESLSPERVHSFQLSFAGLNWVKGLNFEVNAFYNRALDLIMTQVTEYHNASRNQTCGVELMANYKMPRFTADWNLTWTHTFRSNLMGMNFDEEFSQIFKPDIDANNNTPAITSNLIMAWQATRHLKLHTHIAFESKQTSYNTSMVNLVAVYNFAKLAEAMEEQGHYEEAEGFYQQVLNNISRLVLKRDMPARAIVNIGADYNIGRFTINLNIHNLFNTKYFRSGMNTNLIPQQGLWWMAGVAYKI